MCGDLGAVMRCAQYSDHATKCDSRQDQFSAGRCPPIFPGRIVPHTKAAPRIMRGFANAAFAETETDMTKREKT
jgi:hypothetical protein